jgi:hypothetical protein
LRQFLLQLGLLLHDGLLLRIQFGGLRLQRLLLAPKNHGSLRTTPQQLRRTGARRGHEGSQGQHSRDCDTCNLSSTQWHKWARRQQAQKDTR